MPTSDIHCYKLPSMSYMILFQHIFLDFWLPVRFQRQPPPFQHVQQNLSMHWEKPAFEAKLRKESSYIRSEIDNHINKCKNHILDQKIALPILLKQIELQYMKQKTLNCNFFILSYQPKYITKNQPPDLSA